MKKFLLFACTVACLVPLAALSGEENAIKATTEDGKKVLLHQDGKWEFLPQQAEPATGKGKAYVKPATATAKLTGKNDSYTLWYNGAKWEILGEPLNQIAEYSMKYKEGDAYIIVIRERLEIPLQSLKNAVLTNARKVDPNATMLMSEERTVNGNNVLYAEIDADIDQMQVRFVYCLYTGKDLSVQVVGYTTKNLYAEYTQDFQDILNGLEITPPAPTKPETPAPASSSTPPPPPAK